MNRGFTLAELLIALAILGVIATFTIPKILTSMQDQHYKSMAKEEASRISGAFSTYKGTGGSTSAGTALHVLTPYFNYVRVDTTTQLQPGGQQCQNSNPYCLLTHSGGILMFYNYTFCNASNTAWIFVYDPDGAGNTTVVQFFLYPNGRMVSTRDVLTNTQAGWGGATCMQTWNAGSDPAWFSW